MKAKNTSKEIVSVWPFVDPNAIERQEARGQQEIVASDQLPRKCNSPRKINAAEQYHKMGIKVFTSSKGDDLFLGVALPHGWKKEATDHSMWNNLIDDKGRIRATFFYKPAFYDRDAFINFTTRYERINKFHEKEIEYVVIDTADNSILFSAGFLPRKHTDWRQAESLQSACDNYLKENFPEYHNINAYW